jgi:Na+/H+ antiporter NhaB
LVQINRPLLQLMFEVEMIATIQFLDTMISCLFHAKLLKSVSKKWLHICYCIQQQMCNCFFETDFNRNEMPQNVAPG